MGAFEKIETDPTNAILLVHPPINAETRVITDASDAGMGAALEQRFSVSWRPTAFFSRKFTPAQRAYSAYDNLEPLMVDSFMFAWTLLTLCQNLMASSIALQ